MIALLIALGTVEGQVEVTQADFAAALSGARKIEPGTTIWFPEGTYSSAKGVDVRLTGSEAAPIVVRGRGRATLLDTPLRVVAPSAWVTFRDLELAGSVPAEKRVTAEKGPHPKDLPGADGINVYAGTGIRIVNCVIRDTCGNGIGWWSDAVGGSVEGCIVYGNGWKGPDRGHGHCLYAQNKEGTKTVAGNIFVGGFDGAYSLHAYGSSKAWVDGFVVEDNIAFERGPFLIGGGRPSRSIAVRRNCLHGIPLQLGYSAPENEDCEVRDNVAPSGLSIRKFKSIVDEGNLRTMPPALVRLIRNRADPNRAHLALYNGAKAAELKVDVGGFLSPGDPFRLLDPRDVYGKPVLEGTCAGDAISVPVRGDFAAFVLLKSEKKP